MKKLLIVMIGVECVSFALYADTFTWNTSSGDVNTAANWSPAQVPGASDTANIKSGAASMAANFSGRRLQRGRHLDGR